MTATNALIEFQDTHTLRQRLAAFIEDHAQLSEVELAMFKTPQLMGLAIRKRRQQADQIVHKLILCLENHQRPILDLDLQHTLDQFRETVTAHHQALLP